MLQNRMIYFKNQFHIIQKLNKQTSQFLVKQSMPAARFSNYLLQTVNKIQKNRHKNGIL